MKLKNSCGGGTAPPQTPPLGSGQIVGERGGTAFSFRFRRGNDVPLAYTMTATYNTSSRKNVR